MKTIQDSQESNSTITSLLEECELDNVDCPICQNRGYIPYVKDGALYSKECECMNKRRSIRRIQKSNMTDMLMRYTFDEYQTPDADRHQIKHMAKRFAEDDSGWFYICGQSGSGKSHICTAICARLIDRGNDVYYMRWRDESRQLKAMITENLDENLDKLKTVPVLYIDDFFKGGCSDADLRLAFEIINSRYNDSKLRTIFSSEMMLKKVMALDEALGSRIYERAKGYIISAPSENWRTKQ